MSLLHAVRTNLVENYAVAAEDRILDNNKVNNNAPSRTIFANENKKRVLGFGEETPIFEKKCSLKQTIAKIAMISAPLLICGTIAVAIGGGLGLGIGIGLSAACLAIACVVNVVVKKNFFYRYTYTLDQSQLHTLQIQQQQRKSSSSNETASLGHYTAADLRVATTSDEGLDWKIKLIESAQESIELSANLAGGHILQNVLDLIDRQMELKRNIKVHILLSGDFLEGADRQKLQHLEQKWQHRFHFLISPRILQIFPCIHTEENHVKLLVVDGRYFVTGGTGLHARLSLEHAVPNERTSTNLAARFLPSTSRDMDIIGRSDTMASLARDQFFKLYQIWESRTYNIQTTSRFFALNQVRSTSCPSFEQDDPHLYRNVRAKMFVSGPEHKGVANPIMNKYIQLIGKAKKEIKLSHLYLNPGKEITRALLTARRQRNVKVLACINGMIGVSFFKNVIIRILSKPAYTVADEIYEYQTPNQMLHKKVAVFDTTHTLCGSYNFGKKSRTYDNEIAIVVKDDRLSKSVESIFVQDIASSKRKQNPLYLFFQKNMQFGCVRLIESFF